jgi:hypothetical protein
LGGLGGVPGTGFNIGNLASTFIPTKKLLNTEDLKPTFPGDDVKRMRVKYGPFKVKGSAAKGRTENFFSLDPQGTGWSYLAGDFPTNITILSAKLMITTDSGEEISNKVGIYDHHAFFIDISKPLSSNLQCGDKMTLPAINSICGSAADSASAVLKFNVKERPKTGNYIAPGHKVMLTGDLVNYNNETKNVYMTADLQYVEGKAIGILETTVHLVAVGTCEVKSVTDAFTTLMLKLPKDQKKFALKGSGLQVKEDGKLVFVRGHMHGKLLARFYQNLD